MTKPTQTQPTELELALKELELWKLQCQIRDREIAWLRSVALIGPELADRLKADMQRIGECGTRMAATAPDSFRVAWRIVRAEYIDGNGALIQELRSMLPDPGQAGT